MRWEEPKWYEVWFRYLLIAGVSAFLGAEFFGRIEQKAWAQIARELDKAQIQNNEMNKWVDRVCPGAIYALEEEGEFYRDRVN